MANEMIGNMEMQERKEPELVQFKNPNQEFIGVLLSIDKAMVGEPAKPTTKFTFDTGDGERAAILGTYDLVTKLRVEDKGHLVKIRYEGEDANVQRGGNKMRRFKVLVSKEPMISGDSLESALISDNDIGF